MKRPLLAAAAAAVALALTACASSTSTGTASISSSSSSSPTVPEPGGPAAAAVDVSGAAWSHVHNLAYDGPALLLGTHEGLYRQLAGQQPQLLSGTPFDVMGLTNDGTRWLASGHPGAGEDLPSALGLRTSTAGRSWTTVSLLGEVDFHRLTAAGSTIIGVSAHDSALLRSTDAGATWTRPENPGVFDVAIKPGDPSRLLATTRSGPVASVDGGESWQPAAGAPLIALLAWTSTRLYGIAPDGAVHVSIDDGATWAQRGSTGGQPGAAAADGDRLAVLVGGTVLESPDGGSSFRPRLTGLGGH